MPAYEDKSRKKNKWYVRFSVGERGNKKQIKKRGFRTKKEALAWERDYIIRYEEDEENCENMTFSQFVPIYFKDKEGVLKAKSVKAKTNVLNKHILPYFGEFKLGKIKPVDLIRFQQEKKEQGYKDTYLRSIEKEFRAIIAHAIRYYGLKNDPCKFVSAMGKSDAPKRELSYWTVDEFNQFMKTIPEHSMYSVLYNLLFYSGCRIGEALALTKEDIDYFNRSIRINKTYVRLDGKDIISSPKTEASNRTVKIPSFLVEKLKEYCEEMLYKYPGDARIFNITNRAVETYMKRHIEKAGVKHIRVHDLRHSYVSLLVNNGIEMGVIKEMVGHSDIRITMNTYFHLYENSQNQVTDLLDNIHMENWKDRDEN